ncbi:DUF3179 domain-containing protein [Ornithinimicrobium sediminis]|uniref:DUF3179 domain-containing protein n=1 Tax=Ornithinimicrobium sediminis TaxID=2904603 RepID=UPI001E4E5681|nr:DUF3179 domain-containing protein [Ornithinimicrobium sediminis]MCE0488088.1 DUF3179 domain-containing protein [Ornithinimicrobium sediminis]
MRRRRQVTVLLVGAALLTACAPAGDDGTGVSGEQSAADGDAPSAEPGGSVVLEEVEQSAQLDVPSALTDPVDPALPAPVVDVDRIRSGGPPPDGIPAIDEPRFEPASQVEWLDEREPVLALDLAGQSRAYPVQVLTWHEIVNDTVGGVPVAVTYCPLCNSALAFERELDDHLVTFGTSGSLYNSALVMYDRQTESLWSQIEGRAIAGELTGTELERVPVATVPWSTWVEANPEGWVLSRPTGTGRDYGRNPYVGYDEAASEPFLYDGESDPRLPPKERVVAFPDAQEALAVRLADVAEQGAVTVPLDGAEVLLVAGGGLASSLDTSAIADGAEVAATGAFSTVVDERDLSFVADPDGDGARDEQTGTHWDVLGRGSDGPLAGRQLESVPHVDTFWFAWAAFRPEATIWSGP